MVECVALSAGPGLSPPGARRLAWSVKTVGWGQGGGLKIPRWSLVIIIPGGGPDGATDGRVDDRLVWWSGCSKLSVWLSVRVPPEPPIEARQHRSGGHGRCPVGDHLAGRDLWG